MSPIELLVSGWLYCVEDRETDCNADAGIQAVEGETWWWGKGRLSIGTTAE